MYKAKRIKSGEYTYRGYTLKRYHNYMGVSVLSGAYGNWQAFTEEKRFKSKSMNQLKFLIDDHLENSKNLKIS